jgi:sec-independent protein translocase protein TatA
MDLGIGELVVIFLVVMILFGANKLPALGEGLGKAIRGFRTSLRGEPASTPAAQGRAAAAEPTGREDPR